MRSGRDDRITQHYAGKRRVEFFAVRFRHGQIFIEVRKAAYEVTSRRKSRSENALGVDVQFLGVSLDIVNGAREFGQRERITSRGRDIVNERKRVVMAVKKLDRDGIALALGHEVIAAAGHRDHCGQILIVRCHFAIAFM